MKLIRVRPGELYPRPPPPDRKGHPHTPDMGLFDEPTTPAIYDATAENKKPKIIITIDIKAAIQIDSRIPRYNRNTGINNTNNA